MATITICDQCGNRTKDAKVTRRVWPVVGQACEFDPFKGVSLVITSNRGDKQEMDLCDDCFLAALSMYVYRQRKDKRENVPDTLEQILFRCVGGILADHDAQDTTTITGVLLDTTNFKIFGNSYNFGGLISEVSVRAGDSPKEFVLSLAQGMLKATIQLPR